MSSIPKTLDTLIENLSKLPGIGKRTAERLGIFLLESDSEYLKSFSLSVNHLNDNISDCKTCHCFIDINDDNECMVCGDISRDSKTICILKKASDVITFERTGYNGQYHILGNLISDVICGFKNNISNTKIENEVNSKIIALCKWLKRI